MSGVSISFTECRAAARSIRTAEHSRQAYDTVRPRGVSGIVRSVGPLSLLLYVAGQEGRLVWQAATRLGLLVPPVVQYQRRPGVGARLALLRFVCQRWEMLFWAAPPVVALGVASAFLPFRPLWPAAIVLLLLTMLYTCGLMVAGVVTGLVWFHTTFGRRRRAGEESAESEPAYHWTLQLCHCPDTATADDLLRRIRTRLGRLIDVRATSAAIGEGGKVRNMGVVESLVCLIRGVTTSAMRNHLADADGVVWPHGRDADIALVVPPDRGVPPDRRTSTAWFFFWYVGGVVVALGGCAWIVAHLESSVCGSACDGRPATYFGALAWLVGAADHLVAHAAGVWVFSVLTTVMLWMIVPVGGVAIWQKWQANGRERQRFAEERQKVMSRPLLLLFVVTDVEEQAVLAVAGEVKPGARALANHRREHTVLRLGEFGGCDVVLARSGPGPYSPRGLMLTADALIRDLEPEFVLLTGICYGLKEDEQTLGDVMIATQARDMDHRKFSEEAGIVVEQPRGDRTGPTATFYSRVSSGAALWDRVAVHAGPMVASGTLFNSPTRRGEVKAAHPDAVAGDMESHVFASVAQRHKVEWCVVRGISDLGMDKVDDYQQQAAQNAARLVFFVVCSGALENPSQT